jgi:replicative DNA helicase
MAEERLPPQNIEAEQSVLGSILIDRDAIVRVAGFLRPEDFYREAHRLIYQAALDLFERREPADFVLLCDELERRGRLEQVGGPAYLTSLINLVPTAVNVEYYGHIVERCAILRRLITAGGQIAGVAYEYQHDAELAVDKAEQILFNLTKRRRAQEFVPIARILENYFDQIDYVHQHRGQVFGVSTGFSRLDALTGGLQRSDLIVLAARPGMGKTSLALNIACHAALKNKVPVGIFSLEMSRDQLVQRLICAEAGIDSHRLRTGFIEEGEWSKIAQAIGELSEAPIFIDDTPGISVMELRTKARRLQAEHDLGFVVVDYLQLMQGRSSENRVQEVSDISRGLKELARELNVPVLACSQLSRAVEQRPGNRPQLSDLRESGCLAGETLVYLPAEGAYRRIDSLVGQSGFDVLALNEETWKLEPRRVLRAFWTGTKPVYHLTTRLGRTLRATGNHRFLTIRGWRRLDELMPGERIAVPRTLPGPSQPTMRDEGLALLGHLIGDGCTLPRQPVHYTTNDRSLAEHVADLARDVMPRDVMPREVWRIHAVSPTARPGITSRAMHALLGTACCGTALYEQNISRDRARRLAGVVHSRELAALAESDVYWDEVLAIVPDGESQVYDLTVEGLHNFVANDITVHNSIEQDADIVMFIYREEVYDRETPRKNVADIIVAKHRNGPLADIELYFSGQQTRFYELEQRYSVPR